MYHTRPRPSTPTPAELTSLARELCAGEGLCWPVALTQAARDLDPLARFARQWDQDADWLHLQADWHVPDTDDLPF